MLAMSCAGPHGDGCSADEAVGGCLFFHSQGQGFGSSWGTRGRLAVGLHIASGSLNSKLVDWFLHVRAGMRACAVGELWRCFCADGGEAALGTASCDHAIMRYHARRHHVRVGTTTGGLVAARHAMRGLTARQKQISLALMPSSCMHGNRASAVPRIIRIVTASVVWLMFECRWPPVTGLGRGPAITQSYQITADQLIQC